MRIDGGIVYLYTDALEGRNPSHLQFGATEQIWGPNNGYVTGGHPRVSPMRRHPSQMARKVLKGAIMGWW